MSTLAATQRVRVKVTVRTASGAASTEVDVPDESRQVADLLPALRHLDDVVVAQATSDVEAGGGEVSCRAGCGACCRQLVPVAEGEARALMAHIESLPVDRRAEIWARFDAAKVELVNSGLLGAVRRGHLLDRASRRDLGTCYFRLGIPCPFLEKERCSVYPVRPLACREFLVTSPAEECGTLGPVERVPVPGRIFPKLLARGEDGGAWVPLVLAPELSEIDSEDWDQPRYGAEALADLLGTHVQ